MRTAPGTGAARRLMEKSTLGDSSLEPKPDAVDIKSFCMEGGIYGLGTDNKIYRWWEKYGQWAVHCRPKPKT